MDDEVGRQPIGSLDVGGNKSGGLLGAGGSAAPLDTSKAKPKPTPAPPVAAKVMVSTDISEADRNKMIRFCEYQFKTNPAGIGNECLHFILAGQHEIRSMEAPALVWGKVIAGATSAQAGDIAQYKDHVGDFVIWTKANEGFAYQKVRGPDHTGVLTQSPSGGGLRNWEAHLHDSLVSTPVMQLRIGTAYFESFFIKIPTTITDPAAQTVATRIKNAIPAYKTDKSTLMAVPFADARKHFEMSAADGAALEAAVKSGNQPDDLDVFFSAKVKGTITFYRQQVDAVRGGMTGTNLATDKQRLIDLMKANGRAGGQAGEDQYKGDNKAARITAGYFSWSFVDTPPTP